MEFVADEESVMASNSVDELGILISTRGNHRLYASQTELFPDPVSPISLYQHCLVSRRIGDSQSTAEKSVRYD